MAEAAGVVKERTTAERGAYATVAFSPQAAGAALGTADLPWPDTAAIAPVGTMVFTASQLTRHFAGQVGPGAERYERWRLRQR